MESYFPHTRGGHRVVIPSSFGARFDGPLLLLSISSWNLNSSLKATTSLLLGTKLILFGSISLFKVKKKKASCGKYLR